MKLLELSQQNILIVIFILFLIYMFLYYDRPCIQSQSYDKTNKKF